MRKISHRKSAQKPGHKKSRKKISFEITSGSLQCTAQHAFSSTHLITKHEAQTPTAPMMNQIAVIFS
jgi:hypothetical protein